MSDLAKLYATHFFQRLGIAYSTFKSYGLQAGQNTYGQYVFKDGLGSTFHSPVIIACYACIRFDAICLTSTELDVVVPGVPLVCVSTDLSGKKKKDAFDILLPVTAVSNDKTSTTFNKAASAKSASISSLDTAVMSTGRLSSVTDYDAVTWVNSKTFVNISVSDTSVPVSTSSSTTRPSPLYERMTSPVITESPAALVFSSLDTLIHAIRKDKVDLEILKGAFTAIAFDSSPTSPPLFVKDDRQKIVRSPASLILSEIFASETGFRELLTGLSDKNLSLVLQSLLSAHTDGCSLTGFATQLASHNSVMVHIDFKDQNTIFDVEIPRLGNDAEADKWDVAWFDYESVLFPFSLLVTPNFGSEFINLPTSVGQKYGEELFSWLKGAVSDPGASIVHGIVSRFKGTGPATQNPRRTRVSPRDAG